MSNTVTYEKFYTDDVGKHIENVFGHSNVVVKTLWGGAVDAFFKYNFTNKVICLHGDIRIVLAKDEGNSHYKFNQYFLSGIDGKVINIPSGTWFGIHNLTCNKAIMLINHKLPGQTDEQHLSPKIFNWHLKR